MAKTLATFAAGCFWSVQLRFDRVPGVLATAVGYCNGKIKSPTYEQVCTGTTGAAEAVQVTFDPAVVSYNELLEIFWDKHDPTQKDRQGNDVGSQYRSGIFTHSDEQAEQARASMAKRQQSLKNKIATVIEPISNWTDAEGVHQKYLEKRGQSAAKLCTDPIRCYG